MKSLCTLHVNTERTWRGGEKQTLNLCVELEKKGHTAELVALPDSPLEEHARAAGITTHPIRARGDIDPVAIAKIRRVMRRGRYDVCQLHTSHAHSLGVFARGFARSPKIVVARRVDFSIHRRGAFGLNSLKYRYGVDRYIAISHAIKDVMVKDGIDPDRIEVVHSGVTPLPPATRDRETIRSELGLSDEHFVVGNVAHLAEHKGQIHLVRATALLRDRYPQLRTVIVGEGECRPDLEAEIAKLDLGSICVLAGFQSDVAAYLQAFDVFTMPSEMEGLCTSLLDALLLRRPVIGSKTGGIPEIIEPDHTGLLARPGDDADLAHQIARLLDDPTMARQLAETGYQRVEEHFSARGMAEGTLKVYERLLEPTPSR